MKLIWQIDDDDIKKVKSFFEANKNNVFVLYRIKRNIKNIVPQFSRDNFWEAMISCLLTTQQRSGPNSAITKFTCIKPFPLNYSVCKASADSEAFAESILTNFGGIRRAKTIGEEIKTNLSWLENGGWDTINKMVKHLRDNQTVVTERTSAKVIMDNLKGFGPKQSRNLLQALGLTKFETPIDSRITKWLTKFGFPIKLSATALADENYYNFVQDGFQKICKVCDIFPCVMDAAIFSSFDEEWPEDKLAW
jgi:thermostable 8-oxoguanine DNA glycosylase